MRKMNPLELTRLVAAVRSAEVAVEVAHDTEPLDEEQIDQAVYLARKARDNLIAWLAGQTENAPIAIIAADGSIVTYCEHADGLTVVAPRHVYRV